MNIYKRYRFSSEIIQHAEVYNLFNLGRHLLSAKNYRLFRDRAFASWENAVAV